MEALWRDLRYGLRSLLRQPALTAVLVLSLALGIGANTAIFSMVDALLLRSLPVAHPEELVLLSWASKHSMPATSLSGSGSFDDSGGASSTSFSYPAFEEMRRQAAPAAEVFAFAGFDRLNAGAGGQAEVVDGQAVSGNYFQALGVSAALGRTLGPDDDVPGAPPVVVIGHSYWRRRFGSDPTVVGRSVSLNGTAFTVVGVTPPGFAGTLDVGLDPEVSVPLALQGLVTRQESPLTDGEYWWVQVMARPRPGQSRERVLAALDLAFQRSLAVLPRVLAQTSPGASSGSPGQEAAEPVGPVRLLMHEGARGLDEARHGYYRPLGVLMTLVGAVLLIACTNVASLLLVRALVRRKEIATRLAVGGSRSRVVRQLVTEGLLLAGAGGGLGMLAALWGQDLLARLLPQGPSALDLDLGLDLRLLAFTTIVAVLTGLLFGLAPALRGTRLDLASELKGAGGDPVGRSRLGKVLVVSQVAVALPLLIGAGLFAGTLRNLHEVPPGFNPEGVLVFRIDPTLNGYEEERLADFYARLQQRLAALPGVRSAAFSSYTLLAGSSGIVRLDPEAFSPPAKEQKEPVRVYFQVVHEDFLRTLEIPLLRGRGLEARDAAGAPQVAVINQTLARTVFGERDPVGLRLPWVMKGDLEVVGLAGDAKYRSLRDETPPTVYLPFRQGTALFGGVSFEVRTAGDPAAVAPAIRREVARMDPDLPLFDLRTQGEVAVSSLRRERLFAAFSGFFGTLSLLLAALGLYGTMAYAVARRTHETGIRMALGAGRGSVVWLMLREALLLAAVGSALGVAATLGAVRLVESLLFGLAPTDGKTLALATGVLLAVAGLAGYLPARRASRVEPLAALRQE